MLDMTCAHQLLANIEVESTGLYTGCPSDMTENILLGLSPHYAVRPDVVCASQSGLGYTVDRTRVSTTNLLDVKTACVSCL